MFNRRNIAVNMRIRATDVDLFGETRAQILFIKRKSTNAPGIGWAGIFENRVSSLQAMIQPDSSFKVRYQCPVFNVHAASKGHKAAWNHQYDQLHNDLAASQADTCV